MKIKNCKNLKEVRKHIDKIDNKIIKLISKRSGFVKQASRFKTLETGVKDTDRVARVMEKVRDIAVKYDMDPDMIEEIYKTMISNFINLEMKEFKKNHK